MKLWLDDMRPPPPGWEWAKTVEDAQKALESGEVEWASLDHDLGFNQPTGYDLVKWMMEKNIWPRRMPVVHSMNPVGRENMETSIQRYFPGQKEDFLNADFGLDYQRLVLE